MCGRRSPLAEGRELKSLWDVKRSSGDASPLAEGRELKYKWEEQERPTQGSPLAEGRELKFNAPIHAAADNVAPRGGA